MDVNAINAFAKISIQDNRLIDLIAPMSTNRTMFQNACSSGISPVQGALKVLAVFLLMGFATTGCKTINVAEYKVSDSEPHRQAVKTIVKSVANEFGLKDNSRELNEGHVDYVVKYSRDFNVSRWPLRLSAAGYKGELTTGLTQIKRGKKRTGKYLEIQNRLTTEFKKTFGLELVIEVYDGAYPLGL